MFDCIAIERGFAADMFGGDERVARVGEFGAIDAEHDGAVAFEKAAPAIVGKARMARHAHKAVNGRQRTADIEHRVEHAGHRARGAGSHGDQKRPPPVAELFAGGLLEELDSFSEGRSKILHGACFAVDGRRTKADRKHEGGRHR